MTATTNKLLLRAEEAAEVLSISRAKLYQLLAAGELQSVTIGRARRIPIQALRAWLEEQLVRSDR